MILNPWRVIRERDEHIKELEAEAKRLEDENDRAWACYVLEKRLIDFRKEQEK